MLRLSALLLTLTSLSFAALTRVEVVARGDLNHGETYGATGAYQWIKARAYFEVDPNAAANKGIALLDRAPRNARGAVEFSSDIYIVRPHDEAKGNGTALVEISNRGGRGLNATFDLADHFLYSHGFTLVWVGWEFDVPPSDEKLRLYAPIAQKNGAPMEGLVHSEWTGDQPVTTISLGDRTQVGYPVANPFDRANQMTVRDSPIGERQTIPRANWTFTDDRHVRLNGGFEPGRIYDIVYKAKDPVVEGLGLAAIRDAVSFLKYGGAETALGDEHQQIKRTVAFGVSQSGRFLREYLYEGFNGDEKGRRVFDGIWAHVAGAGRGQTFNMPFGQPSRDGHPFMNVLYPVDIPPFTPGDLQARARDAKLEPKLFLSNGSYEYWGRGASLIHTSADAKQDVPPPGNVRIYFFAGSQHGAGSIPPRKPAAQNLADTNDYRTAMRALLLRMESWLEDDTQPPASIFPMISKDQLVSLGALAFPRIPGVTLPHIKREIYRLDLSTEPPATGAPYPTLVPQVDQDGNETSGIRMPEIQIPLATYTGWNLRSAAIGAPDELFSMVGSWIPFPRTAAEREARKDPRLSIAERYPNKRVYLENITNAALQLEKQGFLLDEDIPRLRDRAAEEWDYIAAMP